MAEIVTETVDTVERHPFWILGGVAVVFVVVWWWSGKSSNTTPPNFTFSYGPSDANIAAGTQLAIQQAADQTQLSMATLQAQTAGQVYGDYFQYLTTNSADQTTVAQQQTTTTGQVDSQQIAAQVTAQQMQQATNQAQIQAQTTQTSYQAQVAAQQIAAQQVAAAAQAAAAQNIASINANAQVQINQANANAAAAAAQAAAQMAALQAATANPQAALVTQDYEQVFGHAPDPSGLAYWVNGLNTGSSNASVLIKQLVSGAQGSDIAAAAARGY